MFTYNQLIHYYFLKKYWKKRRAYGLPGRVGGKEEEGIRVSFHLLQSEKQNNLVNAQIR